MTQILHISNSSDKDLPLYGFQYGIYVPAGEVLDLTGKILKVNRSSSVDKQWAAVIVEGTLIGGDFKLDADDKGYGIYVRGGTVKGTNICNVGLDGFYIIRKGRVEDCEVDGFGRNGFSFTDNDGDTAIRCIARNAFSSRMVGDGFRLEPISGDVVQKVTLEHCRAHDCRIGFSAAGKGVIKEITIKDCHAHNNQEGGIYIQNCNQMLITQCKVNNNGWNGIDIAAQCSTIGWNDISIIGNHCDDNSKDGIKIGRNEGDSAERALIAHNSCNDNGRYGVFYNEVRKVYGDESNRAEGNIEGQRVSVLTASDATENILTTDP